MHLAAAKDPDHQDPQIRSALRRNALPQTPKPGSSWIERVVRAPFTWIIVVLLGLEIWATVENLATMSDSLRSYPGESVAAGLKTSAKYAAYTLVPLALLILWADRFRPQRFWIWLVTLGWGGAIAVFASLHINTWAAQQLSILGPNPDSGSRAAVFVAPWVEEATKGSIVFLLAILMRYQWVSRLTGVALAGLAGAGFAFTENILYYARMYQAAGQTFGAVQPEDAVKMLAGVRGGWTFFAHPLFTMMIGIGVAVAVRTRSKLVRVIAPLIGYVAAAFLHMAFNGTSTVAGDGPMLLVMYFGVAVPLVLSLVFMIIRQVITERNLIRQRLTDYVQMGWLEPEDPQYAPAIWARIRVLVLGLLTRSFLPTLSMQRSLTELAYLRDAMSRGIVDDAGLLREKQLLYKIRALRGRAIVDPAVHPPLPRIRLPWRRGNAAAQLPGAPAPAFGAPAAAAQHAASTPPALGPAATQYSEVDPRWKPPGQ